LSRESRDVVGSCMSPTIKIMEIQKKNHSGSFTMDSYSLTSKLGL
jgi:hypothetical protein